MRLSYVHHAHKSRFMTISDACIYTVLSMGFWKLINDAKSVGSWGSAPDPDGGAYSAPPYPLAAIVPLPSLIIHYGHPPHSIPVSAPGLLQHSEQKLKIRNTWVHAQHGTYSVAHARRNRACWLGKTASLYACTTLQSMKVLSECSLMLSFQLVMCLA